MSLREITRRESPYKSKCISEFPSNIKLGRDEELLYYSDSTCREACLIAYTRKQCNCTDPLSMGARQLTDFSTAKFCSVNFGSLSRNCVNEARHNYMKISQIDETPCGCGLDCKTQKYMVKFNPFFSKANNRTVRVPYQF